MLFAHDDCSCFTCLTLIWKWWTCWLFWCSMQYKLHHTFMAISFAWRAVREMESCPSDFPTLSVRIHSSQKTIVTFRVILMTCPAPINYFISQIRLLIFLPIFFGCGPTAWLWNNKPDVLQEFAISIVISWRKIVFIAS